MPSRDNRPLEQSRAVRRVPLYYFTAEHYRAVQVIVFVDAHSYRKDTVTQSDPIPTWHAAEPVVPASAGDGY